MANPLLSVRISQELSDKLDAHCQQWGVSRSEATIEALMLLLNPPAPDDEISKLKARVEKLERYGLGSPSAPVVR